MQVLTPVGRFPMRLTGVRFGPKGPIIDAAMGEWRTEVEIERRDLPLILGALSVVALTAVVARASGKRRSGGPGRA